MTLVFEIKDTIIIKRNQLNYNNKFMKALSKKINTFEKQKKETMFDIASLKLCYLIDLLVCFLLSLSRLH